MAETVATADDEDRGDNPDLQRLKTEILTYVSSRFEQRRQVIFLSNVGQELSKKGVNFRALLGEKKLADFIREEMGEQIQVVPSPHDSKILAAVPAGIDLAKEIDPFGRHRQARVETASVRQPDIEKKLPVGRALVVAFSRMIPEGHQRVVRLNPVLEFQDYPADGERPEGITLDADMIAPPTEGNKDEWEQQVQNSILRWAALNSIPLSKIVRVSKDREAPRSVLEVLLSSLSPSDLQRIMMPLDIVNHLRRKQV